MTKTFKDEILFGFSNFNHWLLFEICDLFFGIFTNSTNHLKVAVNADANAQKSTK